MNEPIDPNSRPGPLQHIDDDTPAPIDVVNERFYGNPINEFLNGVMMDLRAKLAIDFLKAELTGTQPGPASIPPNDRVKYAFDLADAVLWEAAERGYLEPLPDGYSVPTALEENLRLGARANIRQQLMGQEIAAEVGPRLTPVPPAGPMSMPQRRPPNRRS